MTEIILWRRLDIPGHEIGRLMRRDNGWELSGTALFSYEHAPCKLDYAVNCNADWRTQSAKITGSVGDKKVNLEVSVDPQQKWYLNGMEYAAVAGCIDIDLGFS